MVIKRKTCRPTAQFRPLRDTSPIYKELAGSWVDQLQWGVDMAMGALPPNCPLRRALDKEIAEMTPGKMKPDCQATSTTCQWTKLPPDQTGDEIQIGGFVQQFLRRGRGHHGRRLAPHHRFVVGAALEPLVDQVIPGGRALLEPVNRTQGTKHVRVAFVVHADVDA